MKTTSNVQRPTSKVELSDSGTSSSFRQFFWRAVAVIIGLLFIYAGVVKLVDPVEFARDIDNYKMLSWHSSVWLALYLPWLEIFAGLALIAGVFFRGGVFILTVLMFVFIAVSIVAKARGLDINCGCFGHASKYLSFAWHLALDFLLLTALLFLSLRQRLLPSRPG